MIVTLKKGTSDVQMNEFISSWEQRGFGVHVSKGENLTILGLLGEHWYFYCCRYAHATRDNHTPR